MIDEAGPNVHPRVGVEHWDGKNWVDAEGKPRVARWILKVGRML